MVVEPKHEEKLLMEVESLKNAMEKMKLEAAQKEAKLQETIADLEIKVLKSEFSVDRFRHNKAHFKFYTGFESYELFLVIDFVTNSQL